MNSTSPAAPISIVLADDHVLLRTGLRMLLEREPAFQIVGEASDGEELLRLVDEKTPDIAIVDISMPRVDGFACIREIRSKGLRTRVIVLTMHDDEGYIREVMRIGASGYVQKSSVDTELFQAIREVSRGNIYLSSEDSRRMLQLLIAEPLKGPEKDDPYVILSAREREVLKRIAQGHSLKEIGDQMHLSIKTVDTYKTRILEKLNYTKKSELVSYALKYGFISEKDAAPIAPGNMGNI